MPDRFGKINDNLLRGGMPSDEDLKMLKDIWGIERIVSLDGPIGKDIDPVCKELGLEHEILHLGDGTHENVPTLARYIVPDLDSKPTYVHCRHGKDRTGMACALFRISNGWELGDALAEAFKMGMGKGLPPKVKQSYYDAVKKWSKKIKKSDDNSSDAVDISRESTAINNMNPTFDSYDMPQYSRHSYFEFSDPKTDYLNRPASKKLYCNNPDKINQIWYDTKGDNKYSGTIGSNAKLKVFEESPNKSSFQNAVIEGYDVLEFDGNYIVLNPEVMIDIEGDPDVNNAGVLVGQHDNYTGSAITVAPGSGNSFMESGYGGFAGPVTLPNQGLEM